MKENQDSIIEPTATEESPLATPKRKQRSPYRKQSSAERMMRGLLKAFEYEVAESFDDEECDADTFPDEDPEMERQKYRPVRYRYGRLMIVLVFIASVLFAAGWFSRGIAQKTTPKATNAKQIMELANESAIDGLSNGAVAADHEVCSKVGTSILVKGGNAVDAAVATTLCLGVANPASSGLGGGAFLLIHSDRVNHESRASSRSMPKFVDRRDPDFPTDAKKVTEVIDCRETAPGAATQDMYSSKPRYASAIGGLAVAVPGELRGLELAHARHGFLSWKEVVEPARRLAAEGVPVSAHLAGDIRLMKKVSEQYGDYDALRKFLTKRDRWDSGFREGELLKNAKLAETLALVADEGSKAFYEGELAESITREVQKEGGILTVEDMAKYEPILRSPLYGVASGYTIVGVPPPSSGGGAVIGAARFLSGYRLPMAANADTLSVHRTVEAMRHVFAIRMSLSDPAYFTNVTAQAVDDLTLGPYMESLRKLTLDNDTLPLSMYGGSKWAQLNEGQGDKEIVDHHEGDRLRNLRHSESRDLARTFGYLDDFGTTHLSVVDKDGNSVAITSSVNNIFGSHVFSESTGVLLGNTMDDFGNPGRANFYGLEPSEENFIAPGKRPLSSMSPTMVFRKQENTGDDEFGRLELVVGGSGGPKIITAVLQVIVNYCFLGMTLFGSVARARVHDQLLYHDAAVTTTEASTLDQGPTITVPQETKDALLARGHGDLLDIDYAGTVQAVAVDFDTNTLAAVSDIRKGGKPAGY